MSYKKLVLLAFVVFGGFLLPSCTKKDPSVLKIFVRSSDFILTEDASVRIVSDIKKGTPEYVDELKTNSSRLAINNIDELFDQYRKKDVKVAYITVYAKDTTTYQSV